MQAPSIPVPPPSPPLVAPTPGGLQYKDVAPLICNVVDNGVLPDDPRVMVRLNEATKILLDTSFPVGGQITANVQAVEGVLWLPPQMENIIEIHLIDTVTTVNGSSDITQGWYEIMGSSIFLDPDQQYDNPTIDRGLWPDPSDPSILRRVYNYPGLHPANAVVRVTGARRYQPITNDEDYLIIQNVEALKYVILSIERNENANPDDAPKYRQQAMELIQGEVKKHLMDPMNYMVRRAGYYNDLQTFPPDTLGWVRAQIALDIDQAMKTGKSNLTWNINQAEKRLMQRGVYKDCIVQIQADVVGGTVYFPLHVQSVLAVDLNGCPIPIRSQFFEHLDNGPGMFAVYEYLKDEGEEYFVATRTRRRKYKLVADCANTQCLNAVCKLRWLEKQPGDLMVIKNYEALRLMMTSKFLEAKEDWQNAQANQMAAYKIMDDELKEYLAGIIHTVRIQTVGFTLGDIGSSGYYGGL